jgi:hypothetical protein
LSAQRRSSVLRGQRLPSKVTGVSSWLTGNGGLFVEPIQRPDLDSHDVTLHVTISTKDYRVLEVLHDDVSVYISKLIASHTRGLIKSARYNAKQKVTK